MSSASELRAAFAAALSHNIDCWVVHRNGPADGWPPGLNPIEACESVIEPGLSLVVCVTGSPDDWARVRPLVATAGEWWRQRDQAGATEDVARWLLALAERVGPDLDRRTWVGRSTIRTDLLGSLRRGNMPDPLGLVQRFAEAGDPPAGLPVSLWCPRP